MGLKKDAAEKGLELAKENAPNVLGMLFPFAGVKKKAVEMYMEDIEKSDLPKETKYGLLLNMKKEFKRLKNQKAVAQIALDNAKEGTDFSEKSGVNEEWFERFMDAAKFVSSEDMQLIWGKILAGEFEKPGSTPPNMIRILSEITPELAETFRLICSMKVVITPIVEVNEMEGKARRTASNFFINIPYFFIQTNEEKIFSFDVLNELDSLGVIKFSNIEYESEKLLRKVLLQFEDESEIIENSYEKALPIGNVMLTAVGKALFKITEPIEIEGYHEMIKEYMIEKGVKFADIDDYIIEEDENDVLTLTKKNK